MSYEHGTRMTSVGKTWIRCKVNAGALVDTAFNSRQNMDQVQSECRCTCWHCF